MANQPLEVGRSSLQWADIERFIEERPALSIAEEAMAAVAKGHRFLQRQVESGHPIYGINTGFGKFCRIQISPEETRQLQHNLLVSHAVGTGPLAPKPVVHLMFLFKVQGLAHEHSGVRPLLIERLVALYHHHILPEVPIIGSLGASGDLAPLAHFALPLIGEGSVHFKGRRLAARKALQQVGLQPLTLGPKEGLALINGTQFMTACGAYALYRIERIFRAFLRIAALEVEAFDALASPFDERLNALRRHPHQQHVAATVRHLLNDSPTFRNPDKPYVQDPYSFRCIPQVYGTVAEAIERFRYILLQEVDGITDNPHLFPESDAVLSGGNFHGQRLAWAADAFAISLYYLSAMAERRMNQLISGERGLPPFLTTHGGLNSGLMIIHYTTAALVNRLRQLTFPASNHSLPTSLGQEDYVSMGGNALARLLDAADLLEQQASYQLLTAVQALRLRPSRMLGQLARSTLEALSPIIPPPHADAPLHNVLATLRQWVVTHLTAPLGESPPQSP